MPIPETACQTPSIRRLQDQINYGEGRQSTGSGLWKSLDDFRLQHEAAYIIQSGDTSHFGKMAVDFLHSELSNTEKIGPKFWPEDEQHPNFNSLQWSRDYEFIQEVLAQIIYRHRDFQHRYNYNGNMEAELSKSKPSYLSQIHPPVHPLPSETQLPTLVPVIAGNTFQPRGSATWSLGDTNQPPVSTFTKSAHPVAHPVPHEVVTDLISARKGRSLNDSEIACPSYYGERGSTAQSTVGSRYGNTTERVKVNVAFWIVSSSSFTSIGQEWYPEGKFLAKSLADLEKELPYHFASSAPGLMFRWIGPNITIENPIPHGESSRFEALKYDMRRRVQKARQDCNREEDLSFRIEIEPLADDYIKPAGYYSCATRQR